MELKDWLSVLAVLASPLVALQVSKALEAGKERRHSKMWVFHTLMATRHARLSTEHVHALNSIDIEFFKDKPVALAWKAYLDHLNDTPMILSLWSQKSDDLFVDLLFEMSKTLKFDFDKTHLRRGIYSPRAHGEADEDAMVMRDVKIFIVGSIG